MSRLSKEERAELVRQLQEDDDAADDGIEYEIGRGDNYARVPAKSKVGQKINAFFKDSFGIDLDDEPVQEPEAKAKPAAKSDSNVRPFGGRRTG